MHIKIYYTFGKIFDRHLTKYIYVCAYIYIYMVNSCINKYSTITSKIPNKTINSNYTHIAIFKIKNIDYDIVCKTMEKLEQ